MNDQTRSTAGKGAAIWKRFWQSSGVMLFKLAFALLCLVAGGDLIFSDGEVAGGIVGIILGLAMAAWASMGYVLPRAARNREAAARKQALRERVNQPKICPGCGATSRGEICEYCGTKLM